MDEMLKTLHNILVDLEMIREVVDDSKTKKQVDEAIYSTFLVEKKIKAKLNAEDHE